MRYMWRTLYALDYREFVRVVKCEKRGERYTIRRANGAVCFNYPAYLLRTRKP